MASKRLREAGVLEPTLDAQMLVAHTLNRTRSQVLAYPEEEVPPEAEPLLKRREQREPLAYILGWREFYGRRFDVEPDILVPRQETETLVDAALKVMGGKVLDIGTGTGCLAITIKLERPNWLVAACDVNPIAVKLARRNAANLDATVHIAKSDLFEAFHDTQFGIILCNPPYVGTDADLPPEVREFESPLALFAGSDGLDFYRRLAQESKPHLTPWGRMIVEIGDNMAESVSQVFRASGWQLTETHLDLSGMARALVFQSALHN